MKHIAALALTWLLVAFSCLSGDAKANIVQACYEGTCYGSLSEAEAAMRADPLYGSLLKNPQDTISSVTSTTVVVRKAYEIDSREPEFFYEPGYLVGGWGVPETGCAPSESRANSCADEAWIISYFATSYKQTFYQYGCTIRNERVAGAYAQPFTQSWSHYSPNSGNTGSLDFSTGATVLENKRWEMEANCPGWGDPNFYPYNTGIAKSQTYKCPVGFNARSGYSPAYAPAGTGESSIIEGLKLCRPEVSHKYISVTTTQVASCKTAHPCHPTTGDKSRSEQDFVFAGREFRRNYHSVHHINGKSGSAPGWSHTYEERLEMYGTVPVLFDENGFIETFEWVANDRYRAKNSADRVLTYVGGVWHLHDGRVVKEFDYQGALTTIRDEADASRNISVAYANGLIDTVSDSLGRSLKFGYEKRRLVEIRLPDGGSVQYGYDPDGNLAEVKYGDDVTKRYYYHEQGLALPRQVSLLTGISGEDGQRYATFAYDSSDRVVSSVLHRGEGPAERTVLAYLSDTSVEVTTDGAGTKAYSIQPGLYRRPLSVTDSAGTIATTYRADGRVASITDRTGARTEYEYADTYLTAITEAVGTSIERRTTFQRDSANRVVRREVWGKQSGSQSVERIELTTYDSQGRSVASCNVDPSVAGAQGYVCGSTSNAPAGVRQTVRRHCEAAEVTAGTCPLLGLLLSVDGPRTDLADVTTFQYYSADHSDCATSSAACAWRRGDLWKVTNALGHVTETLRYDGGGRPLSVKDVNGVITDFEYHPRGWLAARKVRDADDNGEADDQITRIEYYPTGLVSSTTLPDGSFTSYVYDAAHRLTDVVDADGNSIHYTLDNAGNRTKEVVKGSNGSLKRTLSRVYNQLGQLQTAKDAGNHPTGFTYDANGNLDTTTDALGRVADNDYDPLKRLSRTLQDVGGIAANTQFQYDAQDNLTEVVDPKGLSTKYQYNAFGDLTRLESPDTGVTTYGYDAAGNRTNALDARGEPSTYSYDALNRPTGIGYSDATLDVGYTYDAVQAVCDAGESFAVGRLTRMDDGSGSTHYCYDRFGNLTRKLQVTNGQSFTLRYAYTKAGQLAAIQYPDGMQVDYVRDGLGRATEVGVTASGGSRQLLLTGASYHAFGPVAGWTFGNGRTISRTLDLDYRPNTILSTGTGAGGLNLGFGWDAVGNMASLHTSGLEQPPRITFGYDALNRLTQFQDGPTGAAIEQYSYDATGNRTSFTNAHGAQAYTYQAGSHRLTAAGFTARTYDAMGNTTSIAGTEREFAYNAAGRVSEVQRDNAVVMQYAYNGKGEQVRKHLGTSNTYALYDESGQWLGEYGNTGTPTQQVVRLDNLPVGVIVNGQLNYIEADHLGTPRAVIEPQRDVAVWAWDIASEAFGNSAISQDPDGDSTVFVLDMRFPGQRYDAASGLNYNYFRDYEPGTGRYVQSDPIGLRGGINTYAYVLSNPMLWIDPQGLEVVFPTSNCGGNYGLTYCDGNGNIATSNCNKTCGAQCTQLHENEHKRFLQARFGNVCRNRPRGAAPYPLNFPYDQWVMTNAETECKAYKATISCLKRQLNSPDVHCGSCKADLESQLSDALAQRRYYKCDAWGW